VQPVHKGFIVLDWRLLLSQEGAVLGISVLQGSVMVLTRVIFALWGHIAQQDLLYLRIVLQVPSTFNKDNQVVLSAPKDLHAKELLTRLSYAKQVMPALPESLWLHSKYVEVGLFSLSQGKLYACLVPRGHTVRQDHSPCQ
jgi:hypothetical protein